MCDTYIPDVGYICRDCISEFKSSLDEEATETHEGVIIEKLIYFLGTEKGMELGEELSIDDFFNKHTE